MKIKIINWGILMAIFIGFSLTSVGCSGPRLAKVRAKEGESCLLSHKCQITVHYGETIFVVEKAGGGGYVNVQADKFYRCYVDDKFYEVIQDGDTFMLDSPDSNPNCQSINP